MWATFIICYLSPFHTNSFRLFFYAALEKRLSVVEMTTRLSTWLGTSSCFLLLRLPKKPSFDTLRIFYQCCLSSEHTTLFQINITLLLATLQESTTTFLVLNSFHLLRVSKQRQQSRVSGSYPALLCPPSHATKTRRRQTMVRICYRRLGYVVDGVLNLGISPQYLPFPSGELSMTLILWSGNEHTSLYYSVSGKTTHCLLRRNLIMAFGE